MRRPYSAKHCTAYSVRASKVTKTPQRRSRATSLPSRFRLEAISTVGLRVSTPPSDAGRNTAGSSSTPHGANYRPSSCGISPVALATAAISIADFVPSRNELNIFGLKSPLASCSSVNP